MKILIVRLGALGDIVHAVPAQQEIARHLPEAEIHWLAEPRYEELLCHIPGISRVWIADTKKWRRGLLSLRELKALAADLRREHFDIAFDFQGLVKSALLARLSGAMRVVGFDRSQLRERTAAWFYNSPQRGRKKIAWGASPRKESTEIEAGLADPKNSIPDIPSELGEQKNSNTGAERRHVIEMNFELVRSSGLPLNQVTARVPLAIPMAATRYVKEKLQALKIERPVLINPGAGWETKIWPAANYAHLFLKIRKELGLPVVLTYGPGEAELIAMIERAVATERVPAFSTTILQLAALCQQSRLFIGGDTGPLHLAVGLGTPTVALMGPSYVWRNGPFDPQDEVVSCEVPPHLAYKRKGDAAALMNISVEKVFQAVVRRLQKV